MWFNFLNLYLLNIEFLLFIIINIFISIFIIEKLIYKQEFSSKYIFSIIVFLCIFLWHLSFHSLESPMTIFFFNNYFIYNNFLVFLKQIMLLALILFFILLYNYNEIIEIQIFEYSILILIAFWGLLMLMTSNHLFVIFLFLELVNLCLYCLIGLNKYSNIGIEAAFKYFVQSSLVTILGFFGVSLIYLATGTLFLNELVLLYNTGEIKFLSLLGLHLILISFFFKLGLFPLHSWLPEVYQGSLLVTAAFIATIPKTAYAFIFFRLIINFYDHLSLFSYWIAFISIIFGSIITLYQTSFRRLLAYGSMVHMGFIIISISLYGITNIAGAFFYLIFYIFLTLFNFVIMLFFFEKNNNTLYFIDDLSRLSILSKENKMIKIAFSFILFSLAGLPLFVGFISKWYIFLGFLHNGEYIGLFILLIISVLSSVYYIRIIRFLSFVEDKLVKIKYYSNIKYNYTLYFLILILFIINIIIIFFHSTIFAYLLKLLIKLFI